MYCIKCNKYRKFKKLKISNIFNELVLRKNKTKLFD